MPALPGLRFVQADLNTHISENNYQRISCLIYDTDPFIYPALFGDGPAGKENAGRLLPPVFESGQDSMFSKENLFIAYLDDEAVGIVLWHKGSLVWDSSVLLDAGKEKGIRLVRKNVAAIQKEYVDSNYSQNGDGQDGPLSVINVCVAQEHRRKGIAGRMLDRFISEHDDENMELVVLADNIPAIALYCRRGFETVRKTKGFALSADKPDCLIMTRSGDAFRFTG